MPPVTLSLATAAARNLATTTKSVPQMAGTTPRWLLRMLPWVRVDSGTYRINRRLSYRAGDGRVSFDGTGDRVRVIPAELRELPLLRGFDDPAALRAMADRFVTRRFDAGETIVARGDRSEQVYLVAHGRARELGPDGYGGDTRHRVLGHGDHFGDRTLLDPDSRWERTVTALTPGLLLVLPQSAFDELVGRFATLRTHLARVRDSPPPAQNRYGEAAIATAAGHAGEPDLPGTFVDYQGAPRELALSLAQTRLRVHTRVADLYNGPMDQLAQQQRLVTAELRERQEHELVNNREFGLLHNADLRQRLYPDSGPPTPHDLDRLLARRRRSRLLLAHPRTIAAFGRECTRRRIYPTTVHIEGKLMMAWRGVPLLPCDKIPVSSAGTSSVLAMRTGEEHQGVVGLCGPGPDRAAGGSSEHPGVAVRLAGVDRAGVASYLVTAYYSLAVLSPDALGILENVEIGHRMEDVA